MSIGGFFLLLAIVILIKSLGSRLVPVLMPSGRLKPIAIGWMGGFAGTLLDTFTWQIGPRVAEINLLLAAVGAALTFLVMGLLPFIKIFMGRV